MKIVVYGLGIIGASLCASLKEAGHTVLGKNRSKAPVEYAIEHGYIDGEATSYEGADVVFLALPPQVTLQELKEGDFPEHCVVSDICGVKQILEEAVFETKRNYRYIGIHPMAGKETSGIESASVNLFRGANLVITVNKHSDSSALKLIRALAQDMGFTRIVECSAQKHDQMIALTSQLAHIVSSAYVKSPLTEDCKGFTGGSFQDMTRVAGVDEKMWSQLYLSNRENILSEVDRMMMRLQEYKAALSAGDKAEIERLLKEGKDYRAQFFNGK